MPVFFAYDGSINNDWVARYAIRLASRDEENLLHLIHVEDESIATQAVREKIKRIELECALMGVSFKSDFLSGGGGIVSALEKEVPHDPGSLLICGVRVKSRGKGYLSGTISEKLMKLGHWDVMALRIVQPGLLGLPGNILVPVSGREEGFLSGLPFLKRFLPDITGLHLLRVANLSRSRFRNLGGEEAGRLRREEAACLEDVKRKLLSAVDLDPEKVEAVARISDDWVKEVLICAGRFKSGLILMEVPKKSLKGRFLFGDNVEELLGNAPCDVALYRGTP